MEGHEDVWEIGCLHRNEQELEVDVGVLAAPHVDDHGVERHSQESRRGINARYNLVMIGVNRTYCDDENADKQHVHVLGRFLVEARGFESDAVDSAHI